MMDHQSLALELAGWSVRAGALAGIAALALWLFRVRDVSLRLAVWTAVLAGALLMPAAAALAPGLEIPIPVIARRAPARAAAVVETVYVAQRSAAVEPRAVQAPAPEPTRARRRIDWTLMAVAVWASAALAMLSHLLVGVWCGRRLLRDASPVCAQAAAPVYESAALRVPVTMGSVRPVIVLPPSWRLWDQAKLRAVLAHESAHVRRLDPLRLCAASVYRAVFWFSPLSWWLHRRIADLAEAVADDAALAASADGAHYAEVLLSFFAAAPRRVQWDAVAMATHGKATKRMERILDHRRKLSTGVPRGVLAAVTLLAVPGLWLAASATPVWAVVTDQEPPAPPPPPPAPPESRVAPVLAAAPQPPAPAAAPLPPMDVPMALAAGAVPQPVVAPMPPYPPAPAFARPGAASQPFVAPLPPPPAFARPGGTPRPAVAPLPPPPPAATAMAFAALAAQAPTPPPAAPRPARFTGANGDFAIIGPNNSTVVGSLSHADNERIRKLQGEAGGEVLWFRRNGEEYVVKDPAMVRRAREAFVPVDDLGRRMGEKGREAGERAGRRAEEIARRASPERDDMVRLGEEAGRVGKQLGQAGSDAERARLEARLREVEKEMKRKSERFEAMEREMRAADDEMRRLDQQLRTAMEAMERDMSQRSAAAEAQLKSIEDEAIRSGKAEKLR